MNQQHPNIKFTFEVKKTITSHFQTLKFLEKTINLLPLFLGNLSLVGVFTNFDKLIPISYKHSLANTLIFRCIKIYSSHEKLHNEIFKRNRYANDFVDLCIRKFSDKLYFTKKIHQTVEKKQLLIILPFLDHLFFETRNRLNGCININMFLSLLLLLLLLLYYQNNYLVNYIMFL